MSATIHLARHGSHGDLGQRLSGRGSDVGLSAAGRDEAQRLARRLGALGCQRIESSPQARCRETAEIIGTALDLPVHVTAALDEIDFGQWTGRPFELLDPLPAWQAWNAERSAHRPPGGESMVEAQSRIMARVRALAPGHEVVVLVTHQDMIKAVVLHVLGRSVDDHASLAIAPASLTTLEFADGRPELVRLNEIAPARQAPGTQAPGTQAP